MKCNKIQIWVINMINKLFTLGEGGQKKKCTEKNQNKYNK